MKTPLTERAMLDLRFLAWVDKKGEPIYRRCHIERNPRAYWDATEVYTLSIHSRENSHGDYYLHMSRSGNTDDWFCFLINGKWSETFIHLRHIQYFEDIEEIVWCLTRCKVFKNEYDLKDYVKENYPQPV